MFFNLIFNCLCLVSLSRGNLQNFITLNDNFYSVLPIDGSCQEEFSHVPVGWKVAEDNVDSLNVISDFSKNNLAGLVVSSGNCYGTLNDLNGNAGKILKVNMLLEDNQFGFMSASCDCRILITTKKSHHFEYLVALGRDMEGQEAKKRDHFHHKRVLTTCTAGFFVSPVSSSCVMCPMGTYSAVVSATSCTLCPTGESD